MKTRTLFIILVVIGILAAFLLFMFEEKNSWTAQKELRQEIAILEAEKDSLNKELEARKETIRMLEEDSFYIEKIARTKYGMTKKGEKAFQFIEK